ncbi:MAG: hypothetical protein AAB019_01140 [Planctomycetota bacterium]
MGTICFIILKAARVVDTPFDLPILCLLISLDSNALVGFLRYRRCRKKASG